MEGESGEEGGEAPLPKPGEDPNLPPVPTGRSPFPRDTAPPDSIPRRDTNTPQTSRPSVPATRPASLPNLTPAPAPASAPVDAPPTTSALLEMPRIIPTSTAIATPEPNLNPGILAMAPDATLASTQPTNRPDLGPLPTAPTPDASVPTVAEMGMVDPALLAQQPGSSVPAQAPQRKGLLSGLFNGSKRRR